MHVARIFGAWFGAGDKPVTANIFSGTEGARIFPGNGAETGPYKPKAPRRAEDPIFLIPFSRKLCQLSRRGVPREQAHGATEDGSGKTAAHGVAAGTGESTAHKRVCAEQPLQALLRCLIGRGRF